MNGRKRGGITSRRRNFNVTLLIITMSYVYVLVGEVNKPLFFTSRGPLHHLTLWIAIIGRVICVAGIGCLRIKLICVCVLWKADKNPWSEIFFLRQNFYFQSMDTGSVFQKQHRLVLLCHVPAALATSALERYKGLRNTAKEKGIQRPGGEW